MQKRRGVAKVVVGTPPLSYPRKTRHLIGQAGRVPRKERSRLLSRAPTRGATRSPDALRVLMAAHCAIGSASPNRAAVHCVARRWRVHRLISIMPPIRRSAHQPDVADCMCEVRMPRALEAGSRSRSVVAAVEATAPRGDTGRGSPLERAKAVRDPQRAGAGLAGQVGSGLPPPAGLVRPRPRMRVQACANPAARLGEPGFGIRWVR